MKLVLKKLIYSSFLFYSLNCSASYHVQFLNNYDNNVVVMQKINLTDKNKSAVYILNQGEVNSFSDYDYLLLQFKHRLNFVDTNTPCSWIQIFGGKYPHGWGLSLVINEIEIGTICANKKFLIDKSTNAKIEFIRGDDNKIQGKFYNIGWWQNSELLPNSIDFKVDY
ncbi:hypothetical protein [Silvanigrella sp.]|jgi:hypothetical protein|uniref:hypothetical protein n=1 Tax=Silvanigrella sp. TaxID=2024976 RepID=UPI0037CC38E9